MSIKLEKKKRRKLKKKTGMEAGIIFVVHTSGTEEKHLVHIFHVCFLT